MEEKDIPEFENKWNTKVKECKVLQSDNKKAINN